MGSQTSLKNSQKGGLQPPQPSPWIRLCIVKTNWKLRPRDHRFCCWNGLDIAARMSVEQKTRGSYKGRPYKRPCGRIFCWKRMEKIYKSIEYFSQGHDLE